MVFIAWDHLQVPLDEIVRVDWQDLEHQIDARRTSDAGTRGLGADEWLIAILFDHEVIGSVVRKVGFDGGSPDFTMIEPHQCTWRLGGDADGATHTSSGCDQQQADQNEEQACHGGVSIPGVNQTRRRGRWKLDKPLGRSYR